MPTKKKQPALIGDFVKVLVGDHAGRRGYVRTFEGPNRARLAVVVLAYDGEVVRLKRDGIEALS